MGIPTFPASNRIDTPGQREGTESGLGGLHGTSKAADDFPNSSRMSSDWNQAPCARSAVSIRREQERQIPAKGEGTAPWDAVVSWGPVMDRVFSMRHP